MRKGFAFSARLRGGGGELHYITYLSNREELLFHSVFSSLGLVSSPAAVPPEGFDMVRRFDQSG